VIGLELSRDLAVLGAETLIATPRDQLAFQEGQGPVTFVERWRALGKRMRDHEGGPDPLRQRLTRGCGLGPLDYWLVVLCAAAERYPDAAAALSILAEDQRVQLPTPIVFAQLLQVALNVPFAESLQAALGGGDATRLGLLEALEISPGRPSTQQALRVCPAELAVLLKAQSDQVAVAASGVAIEPAWEQAYDDTLIRFAVDLLNEARLLCLRCPSPRAGRQFALDVAGRLRVRAHVLASTDGPPLVTIVRRVRSDLPVLDLTGIDRLSEEVHRTLVELRSALNWMLVLVGEQADLPDFATLSVPRFGVQEARAIWHAATGDPELARDLAVHFAVSLPEARASVRLADQAAALDPLKPRGERIVRQVLDDGARRMGRLVTRLQSEAQLADLVAPPVQAEQLAEIVAWRRATHRVFGEMALGRHSPLGRGLTGLFSGPPGTGKTFAALCLANELGLNLYRIDLSQVVSKYIGETEKSLAKVFEEAEAGHGVLLFDEADALFGKRSEVKDAHDRYANIEVGYLLQRLEAFEGIAILATNLRSNMDAAFVRRLHFLLEFPMPDEAMRQRLWEQALPGPKYRAPDLDLTPFIERFRLSGGSIQNIALAGAHLAAAAPECRITTQQLVRVTYRELEKTGQSRSRASFGPLAVYLPEDVE
jgi:hypothetical protein